MTRRALSFALVLFFAFALLPQQALAASYTEILPPKYDYIGRFADGMAQIEQNGKWGFIDKSGNEVIPLKYDRAEPFFEGAAAVLLDGKWSVIDKNGNNSENKTVPMNYYESTHDFNEGIAVVELNGKFGFINRYGKEVIPLKYDLAGYFSEGMAPVMLNDTWGYVDKNGNEVVPVKYVLAGYFSEGMARVRLDDRYGFIDKNGKEVIPIKYDNARSYSEGLAVVYQANKCGYIDKNDKEVVPLKYDDADSFYEGMAPVMLNDKWGFIDKNGKEVIPLKYDDVFSFSEGIATVMLDGKHGIIDKHGNEIISPKYEFVGTFYEGLAAVQLNSRRGFIDKSGQEVIPPQYDNIDAYARGLVPVQLNKKWGMIAVISSATPSTSKVLVNGTATEFDSYVINQNNYFKLRDIARVLSGTGTQFNVAWDGAKNAIDLISDTPYSAVGGELAPGDGTNKDAIPCTATVLLDGQSVELTGYTIGQNNYFKLRDLGTALSFAVDWDGATNTVVIDTTVDKPRASELESVMALTNEIRAQASAQDGTFRKALVLDDELSALAQIRAAEIVEVFDHTRPDGRSCFTVLSDNGFSFNQTAENIACGYPTPESVVTGWRNSSGHYQNMVNPNLGRLGVGKVGDYWVQLFAN